MDAADQARLASLVNDEAHHNAMVDAMARAVGDLLSLRDSGVPDDDYPMEAKEGVLCERTVAKMPTWCDLLYEQGAYFPTAEAEERQRELSEVMGFARACMSMAQAMLAACDANGLVLTGYSEQEPYWQYLPLYDPDDATADASPLYCVGGFGAALREAVTESCFEWLCACDRVLCDVFRDHGGERTDSGEEARRERVFRDRMRWCARDMAQRLTKMEPNSYEGIEYATRVFQQRNAELRERSEMSAEVQKLEDLGALGVLLLRSPVGVEEFRRRPVGVEPGLGSKYHWVEGEVKEIRWLAETGGRGDVADHWGSMYCCCLSYWSGCCLRSVASRMFFPPP